MTANELLTLNALRFASVKEIPGPENHQSILEFFKSAGHSWVWSERTPWCSAFMCHIAMLSGCAMPERRRLLARSWLRLGGDDAIDVEAVDDMTPGDVVIFRSPDRSNDVNGHVGLFCDATTHWIYTLGGNQSNRVKIKAYPRWRFLSGRRLNVVDDET